MISMSGSSPAMPAASATGGADEPVRLGDRRGQHPAPRRRGSARAGPAPSAVNSVPPCACGCESRDEVVLQVRADPGCSRRRVGCRDPRDARAGPMPLSISSCGVLTAAARQDHLAAGGRVACDAVDLDVDAGRARRRPSGADGECDAPHQRPRDDPQIAAPSCGSQVGVRRRGPGAAALRDHRLREALARRQVRDGDRVTCLVCRVEERLGVRPGIALMLDRLRTVDAVRLVRPPPRSARRGGSTARARSTTRSRRPSRPTRRSRPRSRAPTSWR